jgi:small neutral amino acid transporter SnatA (MarC family)
MSEGEGINPESIALNIIGLVILITGLFMTYSSLQVREVGVSGQHIITLLGLFITLIGAIMIMARKS